MSLNVQFLTMLAMVLGGFYLGVAHETHRRFSPYWKNKLVLSYVLELSFWLSHTFLLFFLLYQVNGGELRVYVFVACLLGFSIYQVFAVSLYRRLLERLIQFILYIARICRRIFKALVINPLKWVLYLLIMVIQIIFLVIYYPLKLILHPVKWLLIKIYNVLPKRFRKIITKRVRFYSTMKDKYLTWMKNMTFKRR